MHDRHLHVLRRMTIAISIANKVNALHEFDTQVD